MQHDRRFMAKPKSLQLAVRAASALVLLAGVGSVNPVLAQQGEQAVIEELVVTGSRIRRDTPLQNIAVIGIDAEQIDLRGFVNAIEGLEQLPFVSVGVNNQGNNTQFGDNNAFVNLLNLGSQRTLTLLDGRRFVSSNQGTVFVPGNATGAQVDLTIINPSLIKRTEVQTVGSGAVSGSDAIAGEGVAGSHVDGLRGDTAARKQERGRVAGVDLAEVESAADRQRVVDQALLEDGIGNLVSVADAVRVVEGTNVVGPPAARALINRVQFGVFGAEHEVTATFKQVITPGA